MKVRNNGGIVEKSKMIFLSLGTNLGNRLLNLNQGRERIFQEIGVTGSLKCSAIYETDAWGNQSQGSFLNQVISLETWIDDPSEILNKCQMIERELGRIRFEKWGPRTLDLDILFFDDEIVNQGDLIIPHPELEKRKFILIPMLDINPEWVHPVLKKSMIQLNDECLDALSVNLYD